MPVRTTQKYFTQIWRGCQQKVRENQIKTSPNARNRWKRSWVQRNEVGVLQWQLSMFDSGNFSDYKGRVLCAWFGGRE